MIITNDYFIGNNIFVKLVNISLTFNSTIGYIG